MKNFCLALLFVSTCAFGQVKPSAPTSLCVSDTTGPSSCSASLSAGGAKKFHPGWGIRYDGMGWSKERGARYALYDRVRNDASIKTAVMMVPWILIEPQKGVYDFSEIDAEIAYLKAMGKRVALR